MQTVKELPSHSITILSAQKEPIKQWKNLSEVKVLPIAVVTMEVYRNWMLYVENVYDSAYQIYQSVQTRIPPLF